MDNETRKLLIKAENSICVIQNNHNNKEIAQKFAYKLLFISKEIVNNLEKNKTYIS